MIFLHAAPPSLSPGSPAEWREMVELNQVSAGTMVRRRAKGGAAPPKFSLVGESWAAGRLRRPLAGSEHPDCRCDMGWGRPRGMEGNFHPYESRRPTGEPSVPSHIPHFVIIGMNDVDGSEDEGDGGGDGEEGGGDLEGRGAGPVDPHLLLQPEQEGGGDGEAGGSGGTAVAPEGEEEEKEEEEEEEVRRLLSYSPSENGPLPLLPR